MVKYRKKPVIVEAMQFTDKTKDQVFCWIAGTQHYADSDEKGEPVLVIGTLEGDHTARVGDWIVKGVKGEYYPCKPDIFDMTYEAVE